MKLKKNIYLPEPRVEIGVLLRKIATSMIDVSDGLVQDSSHLAFNSGLSLEININSLPLPICSMIRCKELLIMLLYGGDDYELLFSCDPKNEDLVKELSLKTNINLTKIGFFYKSDIQKLTKFKGTKKKPKKDIVQTFLIFNSISF